MRLIATTIVSCLLLATGIAEAELVRLRVERRETVANGMSFGLAGPYEKLVGMADFALDPDGPQNGIIVDLALAPRNAEGRVEFSAEFFLLKPVDPTRGNGRLFYEAGNRGSKRILVTFQKAARASDPMTAEEFGDGALMRDGFSLLWMGWQWDTPEGRMRMTMPIATEGGPITGLVRGNFIVAARDQPGLLADRGHAAYPVVGPGNDEHAMTVRDLPTDPPETVPRSAWRFTKPGVVGLDGGFEPGRIYDVVYLSRDPKVVGVGLAGTRDIVSFFKYDTSEANPLPGIRYAIGWGVSQTGRFLRHFLYEGFNEDEQGRQVFDGVFDQVGGAGRGSFNHRFGQASRDAEQHLNFLFPVDMFPVHRCDDDGPGNRRNRRSAGTDGGHRDDTEAVSRVDQLGVLQPCRIARSHRRDRLPGCRTTRDQPHLLHLVGAACPRSLSAAAQPERIVSRAGADEYPGLRAGDARSVPGARRLGR